MADELAGKFSGTALVCGSSPRLYEELNTALEARSDAHVFALNDAASAVAADYLVSLHHAKMARFRDNSLNEHIITLSGASEDALSDVDYWFTDCNSGGTSAGCAIRIARKMGFEEIILCGCPMRGDDGYFDKPFRKPVKIIEPVRFGHAGRKSAIVKRHQGELVREAERYGLHPYVRSMSGFTAEIFGKPDFAEGS